MADRTAPEFDDRKSRAVRDSNDLFRKIDAAIRAVKVYRTNMMISSNEQLQFATVNNIFIINFLMLVAFSMQAIIWIFVVRYVSERQKVEETLIDREARMHAIVDTAPDGIITVSSTSMIESSNSAIPQIFGYEPKEIMGMNIDKLIEGFFETDSANYFQSKLDTGASRVIAKDREAVGRRKDGSTIPISLAISVSNLGERRILTAIMRDISERKEAEKRVSDFYSTVSHELRTPLTSIRTALGLLESSASGNLSGKGSQLTRIARSECDKIDPLDQRHTGYSPHRIRKTLTQITDNRFRNSGGGDTERLEQPGKGSRGDTDNRCALRATTVRHRPHSSGPNQSRLECDPLFTALRHCHCEWRA